ncbi:MAG: DUF3472 domain-containing protein [Clostridium sp.]|nr:DUF3472 domain-containing protein [Clostridium sp.]
MTKPLTSFLSHAVAMLFAVAAVPAMAQIQEQTVPLAGNAYVTHRADGTRISEHGVDNWSNPQTVVSTYFHIQEPQTLTLSLRGCGHATVRMTCNGKKQRVRFDSDEAVKAGNLKVKIKKAGYVRVDLQGVKREDEHYTHVTDLLVTTENGLLTCVRDFSNYWGRRGPSVHMNYGLPKGNDYEWFYNEVTVPCDGEVLHSYYMTAGFGEGYFGMQYNSDSERRILFSVWSPFDTQDPRNIPEDQRVRMLRRGKDVHIGEFGNEGSGGQSYLRYPWKAGTTYPFLMRVHPDGKGNTIYTAYFYATDDKEWRLIAEFLRPNTHTWYRHAHSFLENFSPEQGYLTRSVRFSNQWARTSDGRWMRPSGAVFTNDNTAQSGVRLDYAGGQTEDGKSLYLKMGGFFDGNVAAHSRFPIPDYGNAQPPQVDWDTLEKLGTDF